MLLVPLLGMQYILTPFKPEPGHRWEIVYEIVSAFTTSFQVGAMQTMDERRIESQSYFMRAFNESGQMMVHIRLRAGQLLTYRPTTLGFASIVETVIICKSNHGHIQFGVWKHQDNSMDAAFNANLIGPFQIVGLEKKCSRPRWTVQPIWVLHFTWVGFRLHQSIWLLDFSLLTFHFFHLDWDLTCQNTVSYEQRTQPDCESGFWRKALCSVTVVK